MKQNFIRTTDAHTALLLKNLGFEEIECSGGAHVFINDSNKIKFSSDVDQKKIQYTNMLCV